MLVMNERRNTERLTRLWTEAQPVVASYVLTLVPHFQQAEDVLQEVAVTLVRQFERYDPSRPFLAWAIGIARNVALKSRRRSATGSERLFSNELIDQIAAACVDHADRWGPARQALQTCLNTQREEMRELLHLRYGHDLKPRQIAQRMGITSGAVRQLLHRSRALLRDCITRRLGAAT